MAWFGFGKKRDDVLDLTERYRKQQEKLKEMQGESEESTTETTNSSPVTGAFGVFGMSSTSTTSTTSPSSDVIDISSGVEEKRRKLAKRLVAMTEKIEDLSNQIYHLQQRIEVLEKKSGTNIY